MNVMEKAKFLNAGMALQRMISRKGKTAEIYAGDEDRAAFLVQALGELELNVECEIFTVDGEYFVAVKR